MRGRWWAALAAACALAALAAALAGGGEQGAARPRRPLPTLLTAPPAGRRPALPGTAAAGVRLGPLEVSGWTAAELRAYLAEAAASVDRPAIDAQVDPETRGTVPGLDGLRLDVEATVAQVLAAGAGSRVDPVLVRVPPAVGLQQLPPAPVYHGNRAKQAVALLINVAWGEEFVPPLLAELRREAAPATFCLVGRWAEGHADLVRAMAAAGYEFCNHGYTDHGWAGIAAAAAQASIERADAAIAGLSGRRPTLFSPHRGEFNPGVVAAADRTGHLLVLWSRDTIDWQGPSVAKVLERSVGRARPGDIILMHPTAVTVQALPAMVRGLRDKGLRLLTVGDLLAADPWAGTAR
jgi:peptidoglycan/xylan/chitin deacetylase (PgdA/CDA1 family)